MTFIGIDTVVFTAPDIKLARRFFTDWGLKKISATKSGTVFQTEIGSEIVLRPGNAKGLTAPPTPGHNFREVIWGVSSKRDLDRIARALAPDFEVRADQDGTLHTTDPNGIGVGFRVWRRKRTLKPSRAAINTPGRRERIDQVSRFHGRASPRRMGHIVFMVPDQAAAEAFYRDRLGFHLSDRYAGGGVFLRCAAESDHHNLFFINRPGKPAELNHVAFEVSDIHEVFGGGIAFDRRGWTTEVGPGRHPISSAYFWYFTNPCGGAVEYFCDSDFLTEAWKPHVYRINRFSEWHMAEGIRDENGPPASLAADLLA